MTRRRGGAPALLALALLLAGCRDEAAPPPSGDDAPGGAAAPATTDAPATAPTDGAAETEGSDGPDGDGSGGEGLVLADLLAGPGVAALEPEVVATAAHDPAAFTQGLEEHGGVLVESTGLYGRSDRRRVDPATGAVLASVPLPPDHFGEGLTVVGDRVVQLTWREGVAHVADAASLAGQAGFTYDGEGWGLCHDGQRLVMSDGSATLRFRDPATFAETGRVEVRRDGRPVARLNELECADGVVWANVWQTTDIVAIDPGSGAVRAVVDASDLVPPGLGPEAVLNGIARRPGTDTFWLTGKLWPVLYEVRLVPAAQP